MTNEKLSNQFEKEIKAGAYRYVDLSKDTRMKLVEANAVFMVLVEFERSGEHALRYLKSKGL